MKMDMDMDPILTVLSAVTILLFMLTMVVAAVMGQTLIGI